VSDNVEQHIPVSAPEEELPRPPIGLRWGDVTLRFAEIVPGNPQRGFVPSYHFRILNRNDQDVGYINLRVGQTEHVRLFAGHIGYEIQKGFRGHGYAGQACRALAPFVRQVCSEVVFTCDPDNFASIRTIEKLGAKFIEQVAVPAHDPLYERGSRIKRRYIWTPHA
jgi:predicted acetyltransferase